MEYDITIIGAGPAGCITAKNLSNSYRILLIDQTTFPRKKVCGGALLEKSTEFLKKFNLYPPDYVFAKPMSLNLRYFDWDSGLKIERKRDFGNIYRERFDEWLFKQIPRTVHFFDKTKLIDFKLEDSGLVLTVKNRQKIKEIKTRFMVDASGAYSMVQKKLNRKLPLYVAIQDYFITTGNSDNLDAFLCNEITDYYTWVIPKGKYILTGAAFNKGNIRGRILIYRKKLKERLGLKDSIKTEAGMLLRPMSLNDILLTHGNKILLVGEAAGLISPSTGEGISFALRSGKFCADALNNSPKNPCKLYREYCLPLIKELQKKIERAKIYSNSEVRLKFFQKYGN